ncbi:MAG: HEAT repeat domain-containing protein [Sandaracinaceae bacterium]
MGLKRHAAIATRASLVVLVWLLAASTDPAHAQWSARLQGPRARAALGSADAEDRLEAARTLGEQGDARQSVRALLEALTSEEDARVRTALLHALAHRGDPSAVEGIAAFLPDAGLSARRVGIRALGSIGGDDAVRVLVEWLGAEDVTDEVVDALVRTGADAVPRLLRALPVQASSSAAARVLGRLGDTRAVAPIASALSDAPAITAIAMLDALGRLGDERAAPVVASMVSSASPDVVSAALGALRAIGGPDQAGLVATLADRGATPTRARALTTLIVLDPAAAAPRIRSLLEPDAPAALRAAATEAMLEHPSAPLVPVLVQLASTAPDTSPRAVFEALSRVRGTAAIDALLAQPESLPGLNIALALAVRRGGPGPTTGRALARLRADRSSRGRVLSALARDVEVLPALVDGLSSLDSGERALTGLAIELLGQAAAPLGEELVEALLRETDAAAFSSLTEAALTLRVPLDPARLDARWWSPDTAPEALSLSAQNLARTRPRTRQRLQRVMRRSLRAAEPRVRAAAALALAQSRETSAWRALTAALDDEHDDVRFAVGRALGVLAVEEARPLLAARARIESDPRVRDVLTVAGRPGRPPRARGVGVEVLYLRVATAPGLHTPRGVAVDVVLPDGRWQRRRALPGGEFLLADLPSGEAEVQVRLETPMGLE